MPWETRNVMEQRRELARLALETTATRRSLARDAGVSVPTLLKWVRRLKEEGIDGLQDRSRRPHRQPRRTESAIEEAVCDLALRHPAWGPQKLRARLLRLNTAYVPAASTIAQILKRCAVPRVAHSVSPARKRFEAPAPNMLFQMDYKGPVRMEGGALCHPLTVTDDHSRFNVVLEACANQRRETVVAALTRAFETYGLPERMLMDNGAPWGYTRDHGHTRLSAWLIRRGVGVIHGRPYHPQTQGKEERFHRTLKIEVLVTQPWHGLDELQTAFDAWRTVYNHERPHRSLGDLVPADRYQPSPRPWPAQLAPIEYEPGDIIRKVNDHGRIRFRNAEYLVGRGFFGEPVALRAVDDGVWDVYYCAHRVAQIDASATTWEV